MTKDEQLALLIPYFEKNGFVTKAAYKSDPSTPVPIRKIERLFKRFTRMQTRVKEAIAAKPAPTLKKVEAPKVAPKVKAAPKVSPKKEEKKDD